MILSSNTKIMIVPDFGWYADDKAMVALKKAIETAGSYAVKVVDLQTIVSAEHDGEDLTDAKLIELAARKLEQLSTCSGLKWDGTDEVRDHWADGETRIVKLSLCRGISPKQDEPALRDEDNTLSLNDEEDFDIDLLLNDLSERINDECTDYEWGAPDAIVVFGKSAMLAGGIKHKDVLFINPVYDSDWPWKKQYYADRDLSSQYFADKHDYEDGFMETVLSCGVEHTRRWKYFRRYGLITSADYIGKFWERYPRMAEVDRDLDGDTVGLAKFICDFADNKLTFPLDEVYEAIRNLPDRDISNLNKICDFIEPVKLGDLTVLGLRFGVPMSNGQSCNKLKVAECDYTLPLERLHTRRELNVLRDAIVRACESIKTSVPPQKRILIVPDYFMPYNSPNVKELYDCLKRMGYYVAVYIHGESLVKSRAGIERRCKVKPFDLVVTLETGCLVAARVINCPRIFVNPDWTVWESMKRVLGDSRSRLQSRKDGNNSPVFTYYLNRIEVAMARQMAERANIRRGDKPVYWWFTLDTIDSHITDEHLRRFNTVTYIPDLRLDTDEGIAVLSQQINNLLTVDDE